jgi:hypothetical protein
MGLGLGVDKSLGVRSGVGAKNLLGVTLGVDISLGVTLGICKQSFFAT